MEQNIMICCITLTVARHSTYFTQTLIMKLLNKLVSMMTGAMVFRVVWDISGTESFLFQ